MIQPGKSLGWEGWLAPAPLEQPFNERGQAAFLTCKIF